MMFETLYPMFALSFLVFVGLVTWADQKRQADLRRAMAGVITRPGEGTVHGIARAVDAQNYLLGRYYETARGLHARARFTEAAERMALGSEAIIQLAPGFLDAVAALRRLTRTVAVIVDLDPVPASAFRRPGPRGLAASGQVLHHLLLTGRHRMQLRLGLAAAVFRLALRGLSRTTRVLSRRPAHAPTWERVEGWVVDLSRAGDEAVISARCLVLALDALDLNEPAQDGI